MKTKAIKNVIKNALLTGIKSTCATAHLGFVYAANATEQIEIASVKRLTGELPFDILKQRRTNTIVKQQQHKEMAEKLRKDLKKFSQTTHTKTMDLVHEFGVFNKVQTEEVNYETVN